MIAIQQRKMALESKMVYTQRQTAQYATVSAAKPYPTTAASMMIVRMTAKINNKQQAFDLAFL